MGAFESIDAAFSTQHKDLWSINNMSKGGRLPSLKARRQDETYGDLSSALLEVPFRNLFPVSVKSYSQKTVSSQI
jgi:hypothetical protein